MYTRVIYKTSESNYSVQDPNDFGDFAVIEDGIIRTNASKDAKGAGMLISVKFHSFIHVPQLHLQAS